MVSRPGVYFTHPGVEAFFNHLSESIDQYSNEYGTIADRVREESLQKGQGRVERLVSKPKGEK
jgi:hypothetical protein